MPPDIDRPTTEARSPARVDRARITPRERDDTGIEWTPAPGTSHLESFRHYDARKYKLLRRSEIHVRFRNGSEYVYYSQDHERFAQIFALMSSAAHPGQIRNTMLNDCSYEKRVSGTRKVRRRG